MNKAIEDVIVERKRQIDKEGWTPEHDDEHHNGEMARASAVYALQSANTGIDQAILWALWPWEMVWLKPKNRRSDLVRAAALLIAEIERLDRQAL